MAVTALVQQAAIEVTFQTNVAAIIQQTAIEVTFLPGVAPIDTLPVKIILRGVKRYRAGKEPEECPEAPVLPDVKRAI